MKKPWQLLGEVCPAAGPDDEQEAIERVRSIVAQFGVTNTVADRVARDLAESAAGGPRHLSPAGDSVSYRVFVPLEQKIAGDAGQNWAFFLVTHAGCGHNPDAAEGRAIIQVFLYPAVPSDPNCAPEL